MKLSIQSDKAYIIIIVLIFSLIFSSMFIFTKKHSLNLSELENYSYNLVFTSTLADDMVNNLIQKEDSLLTEYDNKKIDEFNIEYSIKSQNTLINLNKLNELSKGLILRKIFLFFLQKINYSEYNLDSLLDFIDADNEKRFKGAEKLDYSGLLTKPADNYLLTVSEISLIKYFDSDSKNDLIKKFCTVKGSGYFNFNKIPFEMFKLFFSDSINFPMEKLKFLQKKQIKSFDELSPVISVLNNETQSMIKSLIRFNDDCIKITLNIKNNISEFDYIYYIKIDTQNTGKSFLITDKYF